MEIITQTVDVIITIVTLIGAGIAGFGGITLFQAYSNDNGAKIAVGWASVVAGGGIILIAQRVLPMITSYLG